MQPISLSQMVSFFFSVAGRATRGEYLLGLGFIFTLNVAIINLMIGQATSPVNMATLFLVTLPFLPSQFVIAVRRCHDIGLPGVFVFLFLVPMVGIFWLAALAVFPGNQDVNKYGAPVRYRPE